MKHRVYSLLDVKARTYGALVVAANDGHCIRGLREAVPGSGSQLEKYPEDFHLMYLGEFDYETGVLEGNLPMLVTTVREALEVSDGR